MTLVQSRYICGVTILVSHFFALGLFVVLGLYYRSGAGDFADVIAGTLTIMPLTLTYATTFTRYVVAKGKQTSADADPGIELRDFLVMYGIILLFCLTLIVSIWYLYSNELLIGGHENLKIVTGAIEVVFGTFLGLIFGSLFPMQWENS